MRLTAPARWKHWSQSLRGALVSVAETYRSSLLEASVSVAETNGSSNWKHCSQSRAQRLQLLEAPLSVAETDNSSYWSNRSHLRRSTSAAAGTKTHSSSCWNQDQRFELLEPLVTVAMANGPSRRNFDVEKG
ncbi:hypothetical protein PCASD_03106 [Puccinia coronata f. sp. avenae]|uniref:Uncharacterized protein n=1 Tax=Puccinia coronata f. sp. avenae TaxID=200324 RepID=A0A2N5V5R7_9BASI|nr:hypothetical protein PCASD_11115 [Puccinia coronata f. sp. avenae]PLW45328.1 hypothetical protein PCASD_03106 [Puccinia coronata f. sp. avenae]